MFELLVDPEGELITDSKEIQSVFTSYNTEVYSTLERHKSGIHHPDWSWQTGGTKEDFYGRVSHHGISPHILEIIWNVMTDVPKAAAVQQELSGLFEVPPAFEEVTKWTKSVLRMKWKNKEEAWKIVDSTKYGPSYRTTLPGRVDPDLCILILEEIKGKLHGQQRQTLRSNI